MPVPSLFNLSKQRLIQNVAMLTDVGDVPYDLLRGVLIRIENPDQLRDIEQNSPQLRGETGEIWFKFIKRDIPGWDTKAHEPKDPKNWSRVYYKLKRDAEAERKEQEENLKAQLLKVQESRAQKTSIIDVGNVAYGRSGRRFVQPRGPISTVRKTGKPALDKFTKALKDAKAAMPRVNIREQWKKEQEAKRGTVKVAPRHMVENHLDAVTGISPENFYIKRRFDATPTDSESEGKKKAAEEPSRKRVVKPKRPEGPLVRRLSETPPPRPSLPTGETFKAPTLPAAAAPKKRKRPEANPLMAPKRPRKA